MPHFATVGCPTQLFPSQQPEAHVVALHWAAHAPLVQIKPAAQAVQLAPATPHAPLSVPERQAPAASLQPVVQVTAAQEPDWQERLVAQGAHAWPDLPHC